MEAVFVSSRSLVSPHPSLSPSPPPSPPLHTFPNPSRLPASPPLPNPPPSPIAPPSPPPSIPAESWLCAGRQPRALTGWAWQSTILPMIRRPPRHGTDLGTNTWKEGEGTRITPHLFCLLLYTHYSHYTSPHASHVRARGLSRSSSRRIVPLFGASSATAPVDARTYELRVPVRNICALVYGRFGTRGSGCSFSFFVVGSFVAGSY